MAIAPKRLIVNTVLTTSWASKYTVPTYVSSATTKQLIVCNTDSVPRTFYYAVVENATAPSTDHDKSIMFAAVSLQAFETKLFGLTDVMNPGYNIFVKAGEVGSGDYLTLTVSGMENT